MRETLIAEPLDGYEPEVGAALWRLQDARERTMRVLSEMPTDFVDRTTTGNTIGTILYHVALIETDWLFTEILQADVPDDISALLPADHRDEAGILTVVSGETLDRHLARLAAVRRVLLDRLRGMTDADLNQTRQLPDYDVSPAWVLNHLAQHEAEHRSELGAAIAAIKATS